MKPTCILNGISSHIKDAHHVLQLEYMQPICKY